MRDNPVRTKLLRGETCLGTMAFEFFTPGLAPTLAAAGAEFLLIDMEHSGIGGDTVKAQCAFARGAGIVPMVRVPTGLHHLIAPTLDAGALGIMAPLVETAAQAGALVAACRYRPLGRRGLCFGVAHDDYTGGDTTAKIAEANEAVLTIALVESATGVANIDAICAVPGLDMVWMGHYDLSDSLGCAGRFDDPRFLEAEARLMAGVLRAGKPLGRVVGDSAAARAEIARGARAICIGHEVDMLRTAYARAFAEALPQ